MYRLPSLFLVIVMLLGQAALLEHEYDFAAHQSGDTCTTCLHATPLSHAMAGAAVLALPVSALHTEFQAPARQLSAIDSLAYRARAPPSALSA